MSETYQQETSEDTKVKNENINVDIQREAIELVRREKITFQYPYIFVTRRVAFNVRFLLEQLRKNYWGIFDKPDDPVSGKKLTWIPLTEWIVDTHVTNSDVNVDNFKFKANNDSAIGLTFLIQHLVRNWLNKEVFGEDLDRMERELAINGSHVWKTFKGYDQDGKATVIKKDVDILNIYFDFTSDSIQKSYRFTERALLTVKDVQDMDGWINTDEVVGVVGLHPLDINLSNQILTTAKFVDVWETWGKIPKYLITGQKSDKEEIDGHIVVSGLQYPGKELVHLIETNPGSQKPYEEAHTKKIAGRWLGRGPAEAVMMLQSWMNMIVNIRKLRSQVAQLGIFKVKKGSPVSPQVLTRMAANGVIMVNNMDDIEQMVMREADPASYQDEAGVTDWARKVTSTFQAITGEMVGTRTTVTNLLLQKQAGQSAFAMFNKSIGFFLQRWMKRLALPILMETLTTGEILRITCDSDELEMFDDKLVKYYAYDQIETMTKKGIFIQKGDVDKAILNAKEKLKKVGRERFIELTDNINLLDYDVTFFTNDENFNIKEISQNLVEALKIAPQYQDTILKHLFEILGLDTTVLEDKKNMAMVGNPAQPGMPQQSVASPKPGMSHGYQVPQQPGMARSLMNAEVGGLR